MRGIFVVKRISVANENSSHTGNEGWAVCETAVSRSIRGSAFVKSISLCILIPQEIYRVLLNHICSVHHVVEGKGCNSFSVKGRRCLCVSFKAEMIPRGKQCRIVLNLSHTVDIRLFRVVKLVLCYLALTYILKLREEGWKGFLLLFGVNTRIGEKEILYIWKMTIILGETF